MGQCSGTVLVVEDDPELNEMIGAYVEIAGYGYDPAHDGADAIKSAKENHPSLILLDVMLPDFDGFEVCRRLKDASDTRSIPVVMLTALDRDEHRNKGLQCGAMKYLTKPFDPDQLIQTIQDTATKSKSCGHG